MSDQTVIINVPQPTPADDAIAEPLDYGRFQSYVYLEAYAPVDGTEAPFAIYGPTAEDGGPIHDEPAYKVFSLDMPPGAPPVYDGLTIAEARQRILALTGAYNDDSYQDADI